MAGSTVFTYTVQDYLSNKATVSVYASYQGDTILVNELFGAWTSLGDVIAPLTDAKIVDGRIAIDMVPSAGWNTSKPVAGVPVNKLGGFDFNQAVYQYVQAISIPAFIPTGFNAGDIPDPSNASVIAFVNAITATGVGTTVTYSSKYAQQLTSLRDTFQGSRKYRRSIPKSRRVNNGG